jgi:hypothetical protein
MMHDRRAPRYGTQEARGADHAANDAFIPAEALITVPHPSRNMADIDPALAPYESVLVLKIYDWIVLRRAYFSYAGLSFN